MSASLTPSWYDLLGVDAAASPGEVRAAWKRSIAELEPTDRRFRLLNQAAEVLLDPDRRATYDAELEGRGTPDPTPPPKWSRRGEAQNPEQRSAVMDLSAKREAAKAARAARKDSRRDQRLPFMEEHGRTTRVVPGWLIAGVALLAAAAVGITAWLWTTQPSDQAVEESTREAQSVAERAIVPILSYDYQTLDADQAAAQAFMTSEYQEQYDQLFEVIRENAAGTESVVVTEVVATSIVRSGEDRVDVLLFVNRPTINKQDKTPIVYRDQVTVQMQRVDGEWLVDDLITTPVAS
ncbi:MAG: DnaJ domain-containing protein [Nocardioidaceae bacterium]